MESTYLAFIAKIRPVGPVIGCTPQISYATKLGIALRTSEIRIGSQLAAVAVAPVPTTVPVPAPSASDKAPLSSAIARSWFSRITEVTALLY